MVEDLRTAKGNETKGRILAASMRIISEEGIEGMSSKKIADLSGVSKSNIFHHFGSIEEILNVVFDSILAGMVEPVKAYPRTDLESFLLFLGESIYMLGEEDRISYSVLLHFYNLSLHNETYRTSLAGAREEMVDALAAQLSRYSAQGKESLRKVSEMMLMTLDGFGIHYLMGTDLVTLKAVWTLQVEAWQSLLA